MTPENKAPLRSPIEEAREPSSALHSLSPPDGFIFEGGGRLERIHLAYQTYGTLNETRSNAILITHALTGDHHVANDHPVTGRKGWWLTLVGHGKVIDLNRYFVICINVLGGCLGSSGPVSINPDTNEAYGLDFPIVTIGDMVRSQSMLLDDLGIDRLNAVIGGSMGAMQALEWAARFPEKLDAAVIIAGAARHSAQNIAFHELGRQAIMADPEWQGGRYLKTGKRPLKGLSVARMAGHITYLSETALHAKFGRNLQDREATTYSFEADFQVESYLRHQGRSFVDRFDANSYLYLTRAMDYFDLTIGDTRQLSDAFKHSPVRFCIISFSSDWLFPTSESKAIVRALTAADADVSFVEIDCDFGHDSFLLDVPPFFEALSGFLTGLDEAHQ